MIEQSLSTKQFRTDTVCDRTTNSSVALIREQVVFGMAVSIDGGAAPFLLERIFITAYINSLLIMFMCHVRKVLLFVCRYVMCHVRKVQPFVCRYVMCHVRKVLPFVCRYVLCHVRKVLSFVCRYFMCHVRKVLSFVCR